MGVAGAYEKRAMQQANPKAASGIAMAVNSHPCLDSSEPGIRVLIRQLNGWVPGIGDVVSDLNGSGIWFGNSMVRGSGS